MDYMQQGFDDELIKLAGLSPKIKTKIFGFLKRMNPKRKKAYYDALIERKGRLSLDDAVKKAMEAERDTFSRKTAPFLYAGGGGLVGGLIAKGSKGKSKDSDDEKDSGSTSAPVPSVLYKYNTNGISYPGKYEPYQLEGRL